MSQSRTLPGLAEELAAIKGASLWKTERPITSPQSAHIKVGNSREMLNFCANNYLGLADHPALIEAAKQALDSHGLGMASVRFICGTNDLHQALESKIAAYLGMEDCITFAACFDANGDMMDLEAQLKAARAANARRVVIVTDGVFSMDGYFADLVSIRALADKYDALIMVDDCHATGFIGPKGAGTPARAGVKVDILTGTLGKALGGSMGGYISASKDIVALMRQRARPYLFSNALAPAITAAGTKAIELASQGDALRATLFANAARFRSGMAASGFQLLPGEHPIIPVMLGEAKLAQDMASRLHELGIFVTGFFFPVVPQGKARIRTQMSAAHTSADIDKAIAAFTTAGKELGVI